ncbi:aminotransferase class III-fold pyridoxal phosphate-dependent enzyme [Nitratireductor sp. GISD-1A_MAKvit]|uniref:aminotransferase class III-fold pyridoxal phosphate-dependent enzyme n=1 Tax=Nitratireductor sp. GISD-1A_MAKvit TaxID=3234198 RepID=UPI003465ABD4
MTAILDTVPRFSEEEAAGLLKDVYGIEGTLSALASERDQNFKVKTPDGAFIFKVVNAAEPSEESDFQTALLQHMRQAAPDLPVPQLLPTLKGEALGSVEGANGATHRLRLVSWIEGTPLAEVPRSEAAMQSLGGLLGRFNSALKGFMHPGAVRALDWDLRLAGNSRARLDHIRDADDRALAERFIARFEADVLPRLSRLRGGVIHNDANDWNVLVDPEDHTKICGLIDFGDALYSALICEVAIAGAYGALDCDDPLGAIGALAAGFHAQYPLLEEEVDLLFDLVAMRLVTSVTISASRQSEVADNPYLAVSEKPAWDLLRRLGAMDPRFATAVLRSACGFEAMRGARAVKSWLAKNRRRFAPVLARPAASYPTAHVPLGDRSDAIAIASAEERPDEAQALWEEAVGDATRILGIGPWGEDRGVYTSEIFESRLIAGTRRTRHLGLDLFLPAGAALYAPVAGIVREVSIEPARLGYGAVMVLEHAPEDGPAFLSLWGHLAHEVVDRLKVGDRVEAGAFLAHMGGPKENGGWMPHLHLQIACDTTMSADDILGVGETRYLETWGELFPDASDFAGLVAVDAGRLSKAEIVEKRQSLLLPNLSISYEEPIKFVKGEGVWLIDDRGRAYLDCFNNVCHLGHCHPAVVEALATQAATLNTNTRYLHDNIVAYAERLTATMPEELSIAAFVNSGSEANSLALRMMRAHTGRENAIVLDWSYHGTTQELIDLSPYKFRRKGGQEPKPHVHVAALPDAYRAPADWPQEELAKRFAVSVAEQIDAMAARGEAPGFFIAESIPSVAGQVFMPEGYLEEVYRMVRAAGGLCIADEVQVGFGRIGSHWWAFETQGVVPDIATVGKPIGNGHPMGALVVRREIAESFHNGMEYFNTFGGNPVSCAVGLAVIDTIERDGLRQNAAEIGAYLKAGFIELQHRYPVIGDVRGMGLFLGIELVEDRETKVPATAAARAICNEARARGVLMGTEGPYDNVLKMRPSMIFSKANADHLLGVLEESFEAVARAG